MARVCDWSAKSRDPKFYEFNGRRLRLAGWAKALNVSVGRLRNYFGSGRDPTQVLAALAAGTPIPPPLKKRRRVRKPWRRETRVTTWDTAAVTKYMITRGQETMGLADWCRRLKVSYDTIRKRIVRGMTPEAAIASPVEKRRPQRRRKPRVKKATRLE